LQGLLKVLSHWLKRSNFLHFEFCLHVFFPAKRLEFIIDCVDEEQDLILSAALTLGLLEEDGWISSSAANEFLAPVGPPCDTPNRNILKGK
jgi:hypothetical protein